MTINRVVAVLLVVVATFAGPPAVVAAPTAISGAVSSASLSGAVRMTPPARPTPVAPPAPPAAPVAPPATSMVVDMLARVNAERSARGLSPMRLDERLVLAAQRHSADQALRGRTTHTGSDGSTLATRLDRVGYGWRSIAENVANGHPDVATAMAHWMASDGHRRNILSANVDFGVGVAYGADGRPYWTQVFATPR